MPAFPISPTTEAAFDALRRLTESFEEIRHSQGQPALSDSGQTHGEMVQCAQRWITRTQEAGESQAWLMVAYHALNNAGATMRSEELSAFTGDDLMAA